MQDMGIRRVFMLLARHENKVQQRDTVTLCHWEHGMSLLRLPLPSAHHEMQSASTEGD